MQKRSLLPIAFAAITLSACAQKKPFGSASVVRENAYQTDTLPAPYSSQSVKNYSDVVGWKDVEKPAAPAGFTVNRWASGLDNPRWIYAAPNGDIFVAETNTKLGAVKKFGASISRKIKTQHLGESADRIRLFRDEDHNGTYEKIYDFEDGLDRPLGMLILNGKFYIAATDGLYMFPYAETDTAVQGPGKKIVVLPAGGYNNHWTRNIIANPDGSKIFITVGSGSNNAEHGMGNEVRRANVLEINPDGSGETIYASGIRNPVGIGLEPVTKTVWVAVNERDELGDELVPDYTTGLVRGGFYGWPYSYYGNHPDPRMKDDPHSSLTAKAIVPDVNLGAHTASLGLAFYTGSAFPEKYHNGLFIGQHGSWNRSHLSGYKVVFIPFANGKPAGPPEDFLTGFIADESQQKVHGRPVGVTVLNDGSMLVADDASNIIWRIAADH